MKAPPLNVRYVLVSDYATIDHTGKLVVAGLYTEDLVVPSVPTVLNSLVLSILAETPSKTMGFQVTLESPSGTVVMGGDAEIAAPQETSIGTRPRALLGFQFGQVVLPEGGDYRIMIADRTNPTDKFEIHRFGLVVDSKAHAEATAKHLRVAMPPAEKPTEPPSKKRRRF
jgi:hypothetical protein